MNCLSIIFNKFAKSTYSPTSMKEEVLSRLPVATLTMSVYLKAHAMRPTVEFSEHDPFEIHWVDPETITHVSDNTLPVLLSRVKGGSWDKETALFSESPVYRSIERWYYEGAPWKETPLYDKFKRTVRTEKAWGYKSVEDFARRTREIEQLIESIQSDGYKMQAVLICEGDSDSNDPVPPLLNEVTIDIGRDGEPLWRAFGQHRLAIAKLLDIDEVPVLVATRHRSWINDAT